ncbi:MAG: FHA domain-containing protein, partial [Planctomycetaceae bacterium]
KGIEPLHIEIRFMGGKKVRMRNLSQSGTLVNGKRAGSIPIIDGDLIDIGDSSFTFRVLKLPEVEKKSGGSGIVLAVVGVLVVAALAGGAYWYKVNVMDKTVEEATPAVAVATPAPPTSAVPIARAVEQIRRLEFANAAQTAALVAAEATDPALKQRAQSMKEHLDMLLNAQTMANNRMFLEARTTVLRIPEGEVRDLAGDEIRRLDMLSTQFINTTIAQVRDAETREQWTEALAALDTLRGTTDQLQIDPAKVRERIELKRRASEEVALANKTPLLDHYELTLQRVRNLQNDIKTRSEQDPTLAQEMEQYSRSLQNVAAHAELIGEYLKYRGGPMDKIREMDAAIHPGYSAIRDVRRIVSNAERIQRLQASYEQMLKELQESEDISNLTRQQEQLIANRQEIIAMETSAKFELAADARRDLTSIQDLRSKMIMTKWREAPVQTNTTDKEMLLMYHVETRQHAFEVLSLFDPNIRRRIQSPTDIPLHIPEPDLQSVYVGALEAYGTGFSRASAVIYEAIVDPNPTFRRIRDDAPKLVNMLRDTTLPEDDNSRRQLDRLLEEQLKGRSR